MLWCDKCKKMVITKIVIDLSTKHKFVCWECGFKLNEKGTTPKIKEQEVKKNVEEQTEP